MIRKYILALITVLFCCKSNAQPFALYTDAKSLLNLESNWNFRNGDSAQWANPGFNDKDWKKIDIGRGMDLRQEGFSDIGWLRLHIKVPAALRGKQLLMVVEQTGASDIYLNGKLVQSFGKVGNLKTEEPYDPAHTVHYISLSTDSLQVMAVRLSAFKVSEHGMIPPYFGINVYPINEVNAVDSNARTGATLSVLFAAVFFTVAMFHLLLFLYYRKVISNFFYSILALLLTVFWLYPYLYYASPDPVFHGYINEVNLYIFGLCFFLIIVLLYSIFKEKRNWFFWLLAVLTLVTLAAPSISMGLYGVAIVTQIILSSVKGIGMVIKAVRQKQPGAIILAVGFSIFLSVILSVFVIIAFAFVTHVHNVSIKSSTGTEIFQVLSLVWAFSIPTSMSVYLASDFSRTNKRLALEITHVKQLSEQNIEKEREKQQIIEGQKKELEVKVKEATTEVMRQKDELAEKNKEITDSINYAQRIQNSILPTPEMLKETLGEYMVIYQPKDVVSGDFYWCHAVRDKVVFAVADCTGHGVPGAFMSMIGNSILNGIVIGSEITEANIILDELRTRLIVTLQQSAQHITTRDGMDIAVCVWDKKSNTLQYAGANNSLYLVSRDIATNGSVKEGARVKLSNHHLLEILPDKQPIGYQEDKMNNPFTKNIIQLKKGDTIFITSDGFTDQFGGTKNKKFTSKRFRELIASLVGLPLAEQQALLNKTIEDWKSMEEQTDDICVMGVRI